MSIEKIIATIPRSNEKQRKTMREHALTALQTGDPKLVADAKTLLEELDYFEDKETQSQNDAFKQTIANLISASLEERVVTAFQADHPTDTETKLIQVLLDYPNSTCSELSTHIGWHPDAWDMGFGSICSQRRAYFEAAANPLRGDKSPNIPLLAFQVRDENGKICYSMKPEAVEAFRLLGFRVQSA